MLTYGLKVTLLGMGIVFIALYFLMFLIQVQSKFFTLKSSNQVITINQVDSRVEKPKPIQIKDYDDENEIAAVIAAAIAACGHQIVIKNITRIYRNYGSPWAQSGRVETMKLRQL